MAEHQKCKELRERQPIASAVRQPVKSNAKKGTRSKKKRAPTFPCPALSGIKLSFCVFLEIFSGTGRLAKSVHRLTGWPVLLWDVSMGEQCDLTKRRHQQIIIHWISSGKVRAGHLGTHCGSLSRARDQPGGPPPLRSDLLPLGLPGLKPHDAQKAQVGNCLARFSARVMFLALSLRSPFTLEKDC